MSIKWHRKNDISKEDYILNFQQNISPKQAYETDKITKAYEKAADIRKFEIENFWKRAAYFWAFITSIYVAFFNVQKEFYYDKDCGFEHGEVPCGAETKAADSPMIMQTMYKSTPTSFLEEIQRDVKVSIDKARHIVLLGYSFPKDDTIWQQTFAESVRSRLKSDEAAFCSVVVGTKGEKCWISGDELLNYVKNHKMNDIKNEWGTSTIENAIAIFGKDKVRAFTGGVPQIFGGCTESDVKELFYPDWVKWKGTRKGGD